MHLFEALTILLAGQLTLALAVIGGRIPRGMYLLPVACLAPLLLHVAFEGVRWQMVPAYLVVLALCLFGGLRYKGAAAGGAAAPGSGLLARLLGIVGFLFLMASVAAVIAFAR
jgi:hypothetical protein